MIRSLLDRLSWGRKAREPQLPVTGQSILSAEDLWVTLGDTEVLAGISLDLKAGEILALVGPNGAGKSTLLNALTGDIEPSAGRVTLLGDALGEWTPTELAMRRSVLLQQVDVSFPFSVLQVVEMGRSPWRGTPAENDDDIVVSGALGFTETAEFVSRKYTSLSGGERGRAAFARVLSQAATVLLLDEPTAAMDIKHQEMVLTIARSYAETGCAVLIVVHNLDLAAAYADRVALLDRGRLRACGHVQEVLTSELLSDVYDYPIEVLRHPHNGSMLIVPDRSASNNRLTQMAHGGPR